MQFIIVRKLIREFIAPTNGAESQWPCHSETYPWSYMGGCFMGRGTYGYYQTMVRGTFLWCWSPQLQWRDPREKLLCLFFVYFTHFYTQLPNLAR